MYRENNGALQLTMDWNAVHHRENNPQSQAHLEENRVKLNTQCLKVLQVLMTGRRLSVLEAATELISTSLPRRVKDMKDIGIAISDEWQYDDAGRRTHKVYFLTAETRQEVGLRVLEALKPLNQ